MGTRSFLWAALAAAAAASENKDPRFIPTGKVIAGIDGGYSDQPQCLPTPTTSADGRRLALHDHSHQQPRGRAGRAHRVVPHDGLRRDLERRRAAGAGRADERVQRALRRPEDGPRRRALRDERRQRDPFALGRHAAAHGRPRLLPHALLRRRRAVLEQGPLARAAAPHIRRRTQRALRGERDDAMVRGQGHRDGRRRRSGGVHQSRHLREQPAGGGLPPLLAEPLRGRRRFLRGGLEDGRVRGRRGSGPAPVARRRAGGLGGAARRPGAGGLPPGLSHGRRLPRRRERAGSGRALGPRGGHLGRVPRRRDLPLAKDLPREEPAGPDHAAALSEGPRRRDSGGSERHIHHALL